MAVAVLDTGTATYNASATTQNYTFTVSSGATLAVFFIAQDATQTITSVNWDSATTNQACTLVGSEPMPTAANGKIYIYAVVNPTVGVSRNLKVVNGVATGTAAELQSYTGTVTSSVAAACTNALIANGTSTTAATAAQSGASGDMYISAYVTNLGPFTLSDTTIFNLSPAGNDSAANRFPSTGATHTLSTSIPSAQWAAVSCDIVASTGAVTPKWVENPDTNYAVVAADSAATYAMIIAAAGLVWAPHPIPPSPAPLVANWHRPLAEPLPAPSAQLGSSFVPFNTAQISAAAPSGWQSIASAAPAVAKVNAPQLPFIVQPFPVPSGWQSTSALAPPVALPQFGYSSVPFNTAQTNTVTIDKWQQPLSTPVLAPAVQLGATFVPFNTLQLNTVPLGWYQTLATTPPIPPAQPGSSILSYNVAPIINTIVGMGWYQTLAATPAPPLSQVGGTFVPFNTPQTTATVSPWGWYQPLSLAPLVVQTILPQTAWTPAPFPTFTLAWQQPLASTPPPTLAQLGSTSLSYSIGPIANTIPGGMSWQQPLSTPVPVAVVYQGSSFVPYNTAQIIVTTTLIQRTLTGVGL